MKLKILDTARHRNGVAGTPFDVVLFSERKSRKVAVVFDDPGSCAILDVDLLTAGDIAFGSNSWRGDDYEPKMRRALQYLHDDAQQAGSDGNPSIPHRVDRCDAALRRYTDDGVFSSLIDLLADAMHWSDATGNNFHYALCLAGKHDLAELNNQPLDERQRP